VVYALLAIRLHLRVRTAAYDLGIFDQAIHRYASLQPPIVDIKGSGFNLLDIAPQLTDRATVTVFGLVPLDSIRSEWMLVDPHSVRHFRVTRETEQRDLAETERNGYAVVLERNGIVLLRDER
jgi:hypothetical protein